MEQIIKRLANLLTIKSLVTLVATVVFAILAMRGSISGEQFLTIFTMIVGFYFGTQSAKNESQ
jgi:hypothetical protein